jgi:hypothetical protein
LDVERSWIFGGQKVGYGRQNNAPSPVMFTSQFLENVKFFYLSWKRDIASAIKLRILG